MHPLSAISRLAVPNLILFVAQMLMAAVDGIVAARLGSSALAAVALVLPFQMFMGQAANGAYGSAVGGMVARAIGAADTRAVQNIGWHAIFTALAFGLAFMAAGLLLGPTLYQLAGGSGEALLLARSYAAPIFLNCIGVWLSGALSGIARGQGKMWLPAISLLLSASCHVLLAPALAQRYGISGIAISWAVSYWVGVVVLAGGVYRGRLLSGFALFHWARGYVSNILRLALPSISTTLLSNLCIVLGIRYAAGYGQDVLIGFGIAARLEYVLIPFAFSIGVSLIPLAGQARGAGEHLTARKLAMTGVVASGILLGIIGTVIAVFPQLWLRWFEIPAAAQIAAVHYLRYVGPFYLFFGFGLTAYFVGQAYGRIMPAVGSSAVRVLAIALGGWAAAMLSPDPRVLFAVIALAFFLHGLFNLLAVHAISKPPVPAAASLAGAGG